MLKKIYIPLILLSTIILGCDDCYDYNRNFTPSLSIPKHLSISNSGEYSCDFRANTLHVDLISSNLNWEVTDIPSWINVNPLSGNTTTELSISIDENPSGELNREAYLKVVSKDNDAEPCIIHINQQHSIPFLKIPNDNYKLPNEGGVIKCIIETNCQWVSNCDDYDWIHSIDDNERNIVNITVDKNPQQKIRVGYVNIKTAKKELRIIIIQI